MAQPPLPKQRTPKGSRSQLTANSTDSNGGRATTDPRFASLASDPRFSLQSRRQARAKVDKRFAHMLKDDDFSRKASVDRYGRRIPKDSGRKELEKLYRVEDEDEDEENEKENDEDEDEAAAKELKRMNQEEKRKYDPAREGGFDESSSDDEEDSGSSSGDESEDNEDSDVYEKSLGFGMLQGPEDENEVPMGEVTPRLAAVNLDWDHIRAMDLMAVAQSFCPMNGQILKVAVYPSDFGKEMMERERIEGPPKELFASANGNDKVVPQSKSSNSSSSEDEDEDEEKIKKSLLAHAANPKVEVDSRALRTYQLSRLRYYFAVIVCDSSSTAHALYTAMDGREYLSTANFFDLRFVPDSVTFDDPVVDKARDECESMPDGYKPNEFVTEALTHSKVRLTWDEEDRGRTEAQKRAFARGGLDAEVDDLKAYIGSDSEGEEGVDEHFREDGMENETTSKPSKTEDSRQKMRTALGLPAESTATSKQHRKQVAESSRSAGNMQVTFSEGFSSEPARTSVFENKPEDVREETTKEKYVRKERERKARRKARAKAAREGAVSEAGASDHHRDNVGTEISTKGSNNTFDDPFFDDPSGVNATAKKAAKRDRRAKAAAEDAAEASRERKERAELELLMAEDDGNERGTDKDGFDMATIKKAEKEAARKGNKNNNRIYGGEDGNQEADGVGDGFEMDVQDPRFNRVFESHEFAIDPSNPRFSGTKGMKSLLEEARRKRKERHGDEDEDDPSNDKARRRRKKRHG